MSRLSIMVLLRHHIVFFFLVCFIFSFAQSPEQENQPLFREAMGVYSKVVNSGNLIGNFPADSNVSLPIGINREIAGIRYIIAIDSMRFRPTDARCSAYMAVGLPGIGDTIAFAAKNIGVNPKGVLSGGAGNSRLMLVSDHLIRIGPKISMLLKNDGYNYIEWNCNGFQAIHLKGYFKFSGTMLEPDSPADSAVTASFEVHTNDIHNFVTQVSITPFKLKGIHDLSFTVTDATVDMSDVLNAGGMVFPSGYQLAYPNTAMWTGFYVRQLTVKLPKELSKKNQSRTEISATNLVIDNSGISGLFSSNNVLALSNSDIGGWQFSIDQLQMNIAQNHLNGGGISGQLKIPGLENNSIAYNASVFENPGNNELDYGFAVSPQSNLSANVLSASVDLYPTSKIIMTKMNGKFRPKADLTGQIKFSSSSANTGKLNFQNLVIESDAPYLSSGVFDYVAASGSADNKLGKFPITLDHIHIGNAQNAPYVYFSVGLNFMNAADQGFAADAGFKIITKFEPDPNDAARPKWKFDQVEVADISVNVQTQAYALHGIIVFKDNDPKYGDAFAGRLDFDMESAKLSVDIDAIFGAKDSYKFFYVDGALSMPQPVIICCGIGIYKFMGGLYYHMSQPSGYENNLYSASFGSVPNYIPNPNVGLGFKAGVTLGLVGAEDAFNSDAAFEVQFNSTQNGGGISLMKYTGDAFFMTSIAARQGKRYTDVPVGASMQMTYDFNQSIFHSTFNAAFHVEGVNGILPSVFHVEPSKWYFYAGRPSARGYVNIADVATVAGYFMTGTELEPMAPLPYQISNAFGNVSNRDPGKLSSGKGYCMGAELSTSSQNEFGFDFFTVYGSVNMMLGFDAMLNKYAPEYLCPNTNTHPGFDGWYLKGQVYGYFSAQVGVKGEIGISGLKKDFNLQVFSGSAAVYLYAELIKPTYVSGGISCTYDILNVVSGSFDFDFSKGTSCG